MLIAAKHCLFLLLLMVSEEEMVMVIEIQCLVGYIPLRQGDWFRTLEILSVVE